MPDAPPLLIRGGRVYDHHGNTDRPVIADVAIEGGVIREIAPSLENSTFEHPDTVTTIDATDRLLLPGFVNAHYHSHDTLLKGCFETIPLEQWVLSGLPPAFPKRSAEEVWARTMIGALECIRHGITTVQDMLTIFPFDPDHLEVVLSAYEQIGLRVVFALQFGDIPGLERIPYLKENLPENLRVGVGAAVEPFAQRDPLDIARETYESHRDRHPRLSWGLAPTSPEFCSPNLLARVAELSAEHDLPMFMHINESKSMAVAGHRFMPEHGGSQVDYLRSVGLLGRQLSLAHSVWMTQREIETLAESGANVIVNPVGNLKTKSGVAPIREFLTTGVNTALGCDNCSCSDSQNMFQALQLFASLPAVCNPEPGPPTAADTLRAATMAGAKALGLEGTVGELRPGMAADLSILDLREPSFVPLNSVARQVVFTEGGGSIESVIIAGRMVMEKRRLRTVDEAEIRERVGAIMPSLEADLAIVRSRIEKLRPHLLAALRQSWSHNIACHRYIGPPTA